MSMKNFKTLFKKLKLKYLTVWWVNLFLVAHCLCTEILKKKISYFLSKSVNTIICRFLQEHVIFDN